MQSTDQTEPKKHDTLMLTTHNGTKRLNKLKVFADASLHQSINNAMQDRIVQCVNETMNKGTQVHLPKTNTSTYDKI